MGGGDFNGWRLEGDGLFSGDRARCLSNRTRESRIALVLIGCSFAWMLVFYSGCVDPNPTSKSGSDRSAPYSFRRSMHGYGSYKAARRHATESLRGQQWAKRAT